MTAIIHGIPGSPFVRAAILAHIEKGAAWKLAPMAPPAHRSPEHLARHPFGRVPAMEDGDFKIYETQAILRYADLANPGPSLTPADPRLAARMQQVMSVHDWYCFSTMGAGVAFNRVVAPRFGMPVNEAAIAEALPQAHVCVQALSDLLGGQTYFAGETLSLADLHLAPHLDMFGQAPEGAELLAGTNLESWLSRMRARPSLIATTWDALLESLAAA